MKKFTFEKETRAHRRRKDWFLLGLSGLLILLGGAIFAVEVLRETSNGGRYVVLVSSIAVLVVGVIVILIVENKDFSLKNKAVGELSVGGNVERKEEFVEPVPEENSKIDAVGDHNN